MNQKLNDRLADVFSEISNEFEGFLWCYHEMHAQEVESPIESLMLAGLLSFHRFGPRLWIRERALFDEYNQVRNELAVSVFTQIPIGDYRADLVVIRNEPGVEPGRMVIECDGHDFHERTKEQAERDKSRDRYLTSAGYVLLRFTGREIWRNPIACADQAMWILEKPGQPYGRV